MPHQRTNRSSLQVQGGQRCAKPIMQIAAQATAFLFTCADQALTRALQVGGETHCLGSDTSLMGDIFE